MTVVRSTMSPAARSLRGAWMWLYLLTASLLLPWQAYGQAPLNGPPSGFPPDRLFPSGPLSSGPSPSQPTESVSQAAGKTVVDVRIVGNETVNRDQIVAALRTRRGRIFNPEWVQQDKRRLMDTRVYREVKVYLQDVPQGVVVTYEVFERPSIKYVRFHGARNVRQKTLLREVGLEVGESLNIYAIQEGRRKLEDFYHSKGFPKAKVEILEGDKPEHRGVVYSVSEGPLQRIKDVEFVGNTIASDERLKTRIQSKPGILGYFLRGKVDLAKVEADKKTLTEYYRGLGYFDARIGRQLIPADEDQAWLTLRFVIDEGRRYTVNSVSVVGNQRFEHGSLVDHLNLRAGEFYNQDQMNLDVGLLRDLYGGQGHIFARVTASPRFLFDDPGLLDMVYEVEEGEQFRVGRINVHIAGEFPHTRESVVRDRLSIRTGDIVDIREVRNSERRLKSSQLFETDPANGKPPRVVVRPPQLSDADELRHTRRGSLSRGQSPDGSRGGNYETSHRRR